MLRGGCFLLFLDTYLVPLFYSKSFLHQQEMMSSICVVIDVLRASTTICFALQSGAKEIVPFAYPHQAISFAKRSGALLAGEQNNKKIKGFHFGNSPSEFQSKMLNNGTVAFCTTNGTKLLQKCDGFVYTFVAGFVNASFVASKIIELVNTEKILNILICCAGDKGDVSLEDAICAGMIISKILNSVTDASLNDTSLLVKYIFENNKSKINEILFNGNHCKELISMGFENDIELAFALDSLDILPQLFNSRIKLWE